MDAIIDRAIQSQEEKDMWITYNVLLYAGTEVAKVYNWMLKSEYFAKLKYQILQMEALVDEDFLHYLLDLVESTRTDVDEGLNYGAIKLLLAFNEQYMLHQAALRAASNYTPSNPLLLVLADRPGASCTFGENLIFMLNRAEETSLQTLILKLLYLFFTSPNQMLNEFFYTNDLHVLVDVVIRELRNLPEEQESLRHAYLRVMGPLLTNTQLRCQERALYYKRAEILRVLGELGGGDLDGTLRQHLWEQEMWEQQQSRLLNEGRKLTYRDRESSVGQSGAPSPALTNRVVGGAVQNRSGSVSSGSVSSGSVCSSPLLPVVPDGMNDSMDAKRPAAVNSTGRSGSVVLENVLPPSRSNSSTNLHVHMGTPPPSLWGQQQPPRAVSPMTQRLVERVLREWLENEIKNGAVTAEGNSNGAGGAEGLEDDRRVAIPVAQ
ncbi:hypothetical protein BGZ54_000529 [Gamsiella multidivaricata]|nr:hypothetical protein BGZ54_000529 [Gamsiella multidivaricata]